ncbi:MAG: hypothetical protein GXO92_03600 [FCB group bacterium]|nr:hypothetical protein [FCB group bacterium]
MTKKILYSILFVMITCQAGYGEKLFRGELKVGMPNLLGFSAEYQLDLPMPGVAPYVDFSTFSLDLDETVSLGISYVGFGGKLYLDEFIGKPGYFAGLGFGRLGFNLTDNGYFKYDDNYNEVKGEGKASIAVNLLQLKIGKRWILGPVTIAIETGYSLGKLDDELTIEINYEDGTSERETESTEDIPLGGGMIGTVSIGVAF